MLNLKDLTLNIRARVAQVPTMQTMRDLPVDKKIGKQKYGNVKTEIGGIKFDSKAEAKRWTYLAMLQNAKEIKDLELQVPYELIPRQTSSNGKIVRSCSYIADFRYRAKDGRIVVEDVKGAVTPEFRIKRKLMLQVHGVDIVEIKS